MKQNANDEISGQTSVKSQTSKIFNATDADVILQSSDHISFHVHRKYLEVTTGKLPPAECKAHGAVVELPETSATLELLLQFVYPKLLPTLDSVPFPSLASLADAAEKYQVYYAVQQCKVHMRRFLLSNSEEVMTYAAKHGHRDILAQVAPLLIAKPLDTIIRKLPTDMVTPWVCYRERWNAVAEYAASKRGYLVQQLASLPASSATASSGSNGSGSLGSGPSKFAFGADAVPFSTGSSGSGKKPRPTVFGAPSTSVPPPAANGPPPAMPTPPSTNFSLNKKPTSVNPVTPVPSPLPAVTTALGATPPESGVIYTWPSNTGPTCCRFCAKQVLAGCIAKGYLHRHVDVNFLLSLSEQSLKAWVCCDAMANALLLPWYQDVKKMMNEIPSFVTFN